MDQQIKSDWVEALRSGEYEQARQAFTRIEDGKVKHCCLAVLTDLACKAGVEGIRRSRNYEKDGMYEVGDSDRGWVRHWSGGLPTVVARWAGLGHEEGLGWKADPIIGGVSAAMRNDGQHSYNPGQTYAEIADAIERDETL